MSSEVDAKQVTLTDSEEQLAHSGDVMTEVEDGNTATRLSNRSENRKEELLDAQGANGNKLSTSTNNNSMENQDNTANPVADGAEDTPEAPAAATPASNIKSKTRRKSAGVPEHKNKKPNKKLSRAKLSHIDAKPGEHYYIKLKGYPLWPGIICDESMLPTSLIRSRPVTAARPDGTYRADYEDGGKNVHDRTFPVMYLATNEFSWIPNYDLVDMDINEIAKPEGKMHKMRKDLHEAHQLASENHDLAFYKKVLQDFQEARQAEIDAKAEAGAAKKSGGKGKRKSKAATDAEDEDNGDVEMADIVGDSAGNDDIAEKKPKSKKRKAVADIEDAETPKRSESVKKPKFKPITGSTPKTANGNATPKSTAKKDQSASKSSKPKGRKSATNGAEENGEASTPKNEPELTPAEKMEKKGKEILFLRHKLQKGLLTRDQQPKGEEMRVMSDIISKLEGYADLEVSIIRATKINKVLKAILKLSEIPKEEEFNFKGRSKDLLDKWNKILESAEDNVATTSTPAPDKAIVNGLKTEDKEDKDMDTDVKTEEPISAIETDTGMPDVPDNSSGKEEDQTADGSLKKSPQAMPVEAVS